MPARAVLRGTTVSYFLLSALLMAKMYDFLLGQTQLAI